MSAATRREAMKRARARTPGLSGVPIGHLLAHMDLEPYDVRLRNGCPLCAECSGALPSAGNESA